MSIMLVNSNAERIPLIQYCYYGIIWRMNEIRNDKGQFVKGVRAHPDTEFKKGEHWREHKPFWDYDWLYREYVEKERSCGDIANEFSVTEAAILFWLRKHQIPRRSIAEARKVKHWGLAGEMNGMYGRRGDKSPRWLGGITPERQAFYSSPEWANVTRKVWKRDSGKCQRCGIGRKERAIHIHHIVSFRVKRLRAELDNLILLCDKCHRWVHSPKNTKKEFIKKEVKGVYSAD